MVTDPAPRGARGRHASGTAGPDDGTGPLVPPGDGAGRRAGAAHPSAPLPDLPPRPAGAWSRLPRRDGADEDATVAVPLPGGPGAPGGPPAGDDETAAIDPYPADPHGHEPHWDDDPEATGGLEVLGADAQDTDHRGRPPRGRGGAGRGGARRPLAIVLSLAVLVALVGGIVVGGRALIGLVNPAAEDYTGQGTGEVQVRVAVGDTLSDIGRSLVDAGVIASVSPFVAAAEANPAATGIQPGVYALREEMSGQAALDLLLDPSSRLFARVTVPEGFTVEQTLQRLAEATERPVEEFRAAAADPAALGVPEWAGGQLEGFLFPATYDFTPDDTPADMLRAMVSAFTDTAARIQLEERAAAAGRSPLEVVIVASMVQSETRLDEERPDVAQVIYNRLEQGIPLGIDAALAYGLGKNGNELTVTDLETDSPYNTRTRAGLPPTPISSPGEASLEAALAPSTGDLLYYVLESQDGNHFFTSSYEEFLAARQRCAEAGLGCGG
ncbi:endolytic transglycosylase MltG [Geodermatophilus marinus]|nr:endolytic transglycosylase MltG [Geodermatophilus sp. LHW52908]